MFNNINFIIGESMGVLSRKDMVEKFHGKKTISVPPNTLLVSFNIRRKRIIGTKMAGKDYATRTQHFRVGLALSRLALT